VFGKGPGEYAFDVPEKLKGQIQIIDITDDVTGERKFGDGIVCLISPKFAVLLTYV
jgi:hypothetical protein